MLNCIYELNLKHTSLPYVLCGLLIQLSLSPERELEGNWQPLRLVKLKFSKSFSAATRSPGNHFEYEVFFTREVIGLSDDKI